MNVLVAFGAGMLSFLSPCVLPLVPAFLINLAGESALGGTRRVHTVTHALAFVLGFTTVFTLLWVAVAVVGALAGELLVWLQRVGGALLVLFGVHMLGLVNVPFLDRAREVRLEGSSTGYPRSFLVGVAFGAGFTPCVGPYLALILNLLLNTDLASGTVLLVAYSLGLGVPFLLVAAGVGAGAPLAFLRRNARTVSYAGGVLVIGLGLLLMSGQFARLAQYFNFLPLLG
ncbi:MAG: cytochrome c biogenesis protein CcdA [Chloroflexi bacterium]|nr:cytochrome c biogenesis protein CcdA [Chloroflexota bacterium]